MFLPAFSAACKQHASWLLSQLQAHARNPHFLTQPKFSQLSEKSKTACSFNENFVIPFLTVTSDRLVLQTPVENFHSQEEELKNFKFESLKVVESLPKKFNYQKIFIVFKKHFHSFLIKINFPERPRIDFFITEAKDRARRQEGKRRVKNR